MKLLLSFIAALATFSLQGQVVFNEVCSANGYIIQDFEGDFKDWIEIYNPTSEEVSLEGFYLETFDTQQERWYFPNITVKPDSCILVFCSGKDRKEIIDHYEIPIYPGTSWRYQLGTFEPDPNWTNPGFDDSGWASGPLSIGYGDADDSTPIPAVASYFARDTFSISTTEQFLSLFLAMDYDDAFVAYLNGTEIARNNIWNSGRPPFDALASEEHEAAFYSCWSPDVFDCAEYFFVGQEALEPLLQVGENVLSIQVHNYGLGLDDMSMYCVPIMGVAGADTTFISFPETSNLHTSFTLDSKGQRLSLKAADGTVMDEYVIDEVHFNHSRGRYPDGSDNWCLLDVPTPCNANVSDCNIGYAEAPKFELESGFYNGSQNIQISSTNSEDEIRYTVDGSTPLISSNLYTTPINISATTVIRASVFPADPDYLPSRQTVRTFVIDDNSSLPVVFVTLDSVYLWDTLTGIYVIGPNTDTTVENFPYWGTANYYQDWFRPGHVEYLDADLKKQMGQDCSIEIHGNFSRGWAQKSFRFIANDKYGESWFNFAPFEGKPQVDRMKSFNVRNGGVDYNTTHCRDGLMHRAARDLDVEIMDHEVVLVYLNGEYWGVYGLRERQDERYIQENTGVDPEFVDLLRFNGDPFHGSNEDYLDMVNYIDQEDMSIDSNFTKASNRLDISNYVDYMLAESYYGNYDWISENSETNNIKFWRQNNPAGKWRYILWDTDLGLDLVGAFGGGGDPLSYDYFGSLLQPEYTDPHSTMLRGLLENQEFKEYLINRQADIINTDFSPEEFGEVAQELYDEMLPEMDRHFSLWGAPPKFIFSAFWLSRSSTVDEWTNEYDAIFNFINERPAYARNNMESLFGLNGQVNVTLDVEPAGAGEIHISTLDLSEYEYPWTGVYYDGVPVKISCKANPGFTFTEWTANSLFSNKDSISFKVNIDTDESFTAHFRPIETSVHVNPNPFSDELIVEYHLLEGAQVSIKLFDVSGREVINLLDYTSFQREGVNYVTLDASQINLKAGAYVLEFISGEYKETKKLIKINEKK